MLTDCSRDLFGYEAVEGRQVVAAFDGGAVSSDAGALRLRTFAVKDRNCADFPGVKDDGKLEDGVVLDMDYWVALPR